MVKTTTHFRVTFKYFQVGDSVIEKKEIIKSLEETIVNIKTMPSEDFKKAVYGYVETRWDADDIKTPPFTQGLKKIIQATERLNEKGKYRGVDDDL